MAFLGRKFVLVYPLVLEKIPFVFKILNCSLLQFFIVDITLMIAQTIYLFIYYFISYQNISQANFSLDQYIWNIYVLDNLNLGMFRRIFSIIQNIRVFKVVWSWILSSLCLLVISEIESPLSIFTVCGLTVCSFYGYFFYFTIGEYICGGTRFYSIFR